MGLLAAAPLASGLGCDAILGLQRAQLYEPDGGSSTTTSGTGGTTSSAGGGGGGASACTPGDTLPCYTGPAGTEGFGICQGGTKTCKPDGSGFGGCAGQVTPQTETCADTADEDCSGHDCVQWGELLGNLQDNFATGIAVDAAGNSFLVGTFTGAIPLPTGTLTASGNAAFLIKLDPAGNPLWGKAFEGSTGYTKAFAVATDSSGNVAIGGSVDSACSFDGSTSVGPGIFVAEFSASGGALWSKALSTGGSVWDAVNSLAFTLGGDLLVGGAFTTALDVGDGPIAGPAGGLPYGFLAKLRGSDGSGKMADGYWARALCSGTSVCWTWGTALDGKGDILLAGVFQGTASIGTGATLTSKGTYDAFLGKLTPEGVPYWQVQIGGAGAKVLMSRGTLGLDPSGAPTLAGKFTGTVNFGGGNVSAAVADSGFVVGYAPDKGYRWSKVLDGGITNGVAADAAGNVFLVGDFSGTLDLGTTPLDSQGSNDVFVAKVSSTGTVLWNRRYGDGGDQHASGVAVTGAGDPVMLGTTAGAVDFGAGALTPAGGSDIYAVKLSR